jgi:hypothetical protein
MKYFYDNDRGPTQDRISYRSTEINPKFCIGEQFESYDFTKTAVDFATAVKHRLEQLRDTKKYLRFWFSGGKDSRLILDTSRAIGIEFDEIVIIKNQLLGPTYQMGAISEIMANAVDYIETVRSSFKKTRITIKEFEAAEFEAVFSHSDWIHYTNCWYIHTAIEPNLFYRYVNPERMILDEIPDRIDVMGSVHPHIYWDNGWKFVYVDFQFPQNLWHTCENFLTSPEHPEIAHSYARAITQELEKRQLRPYRFQEDMFVTTNQHMRNVRELLPEYQFQLHRTDAEWPKEYQDKWRPSDDLYWRANPSFKSLLTCFMCYYARPQPKAFQDYVNLTDWNAVLQEIEFGGILTKEFVL